MSVDVLGYLSSKGLALKKAGGDNVHCACPLCGEAADQRGRLYVNVDPDADIPGLFFCHRCGEKGNLTTLKKHYGDKTSEKEEETEVSRAILAAAAEYYHERLGDWEDAFMYPRSPKRGLTTESILKHEIGYAPQELEWDVVTKEMRQVPTRLLYNYLKDDCGFPVKEILGTGLVREIERKDGKGKFLMDSLAGMITIPYHTAGNVSAIRGRAWPFEGDRNSSDPDLRGEWNGWSGDVFKPGPAKYKTCGGTGSRLFNTDVTWGADEVLITEGEFDAIVLEQEGYAVVGSPGAKAWQDSWDGYLSQTRRVFLVYDRDLAGEEGAIKLIDKFGTKIRRVFLSEEGRKCDPTQWFHEDGHTRAEFEALVDEARKGGLLVSVMDAIKEFQEQQALPGLKFNFELLDMMVDPGLQPAQLMIVLAKTGTGKTIFLLNLMQRMRMMIEQENLKFLFISLEQTRGEWWDRARRMYRFYHPHATDADAAEWWNDNIKIVDKNRLSMKEFQSVIDDFVYQMGQPPDCIFLDYLGYWAQSFKGERYERTSDAVMALKGWAKDSRVPIIVPHQVSRTAHDGEEMGADAARDSGVIEETADFMFTLWSPDYALMRAEEEKTGKLHMRIAKSRHGGKGTLLNMQWAPMSLTMVPEGDQFAHVARREFNWRQQYHDNWERIAYRHRTGHEGHLDEVPAEEFEQKGLILP